MVEHHEDNAKDFATRVWEIKDGQFIDMSIKEWTFTQAKGEEE